MTQVFKDFELLFENSKLRTSHKRYFLVTVEIKDYNGITGGKNFFNQPIRNDRTTYKNIGKILLQFKEMTIELVA